MWPFSNSSTPPAGHAADSSADSAAPAAPTPTTPPPAAPGPSPAAVPGPATTPAVNPYALEAYQPLTAVDRSSPTAPPAFAPTVPIEAPAAGAAGGSSKPKINVQPPTSRPAVGIDPTAPAAPPPPTSAAAAATEPDSPPLTRPMNEEEFATATAKAARSASYALMSPGGQREAALAPAAQFIGRQAQVNCSELRAAFDSCTRSSLMGGGCEGLKRTWQGCIDEQKDLLGKSGFGKDGNTLAQNLYLAALADQTGLERRASLAVGRGESPATSPNTDVTAADPSGSLIATSPSATVSDKPAKQPSTFAPFFARDLPRRSPTGEIEWAGERRAREAAELAARRAAADRVLEGGEKVGWGQWVGAWVEKGRVEWAEGTWDGGRGWGASSAKASPVAAAAAAGTEKEVKS